MAERTPIETTNLDHYGSAVIPWSRPRDLLVATPTRLDITFFLGTVSPDRSLTFAWDNMRQVFAGQRHSSLGYLSPAVFEQRFARDNFYCPLNAGQSSMT